MSLSPITIEKTKRPIKETNRKTLTLLMIRDDILNVPSRRK